ncbi:unnamed protein product [Citrullus colocynthis]|uniref:Uncharacterized protein n=1 Tax=Citrullus colocynthis TaxID=252529 RepID=A0ABP0Y3C4_9ROSI
MGTERRQRKEDQQQLLAVTVRGSLLPFDVYQYGLVAKTAVALSPASRFEGLLACQPVLSLEACFVVASLDELAPANSGLRIGWASCRPALTYPLSPPPSSADSEI